MGHVADFPGQARKFNQAEESYGGVCACKKKKPARGGAVQARARLESAAWFQNLNPTK